MASLRHLSPSRRLSTHRDGFALLVTITLVAFLVLVLVGFATLTRVETQVAGNTRNTAAARQNALLALNIAVGQLQKYAGPDQRITAPADLVADEDKAGVSSPAPGALEVKDGARYWTGVWGNGESRIGYDLRPADITRRGVAPVLLNWLVSGNEQVDYAFNGSAGAVTAGAAPTYTPAATIDLATTTPTVAGAAAIVLVGSNAVGGSDAASRKDYVVAPLVPLRAAAGTVPGIDPTETPRIGRYAWWVGDEGVKARVNLQNGYQSPRLTTAESTARRIDSFLIAQRTAPELMARDRDGVSIGSGAYDFTAIGIPKIVSPDQLPFAGDADVLGTAAKTRFHDLTTTSFGVLSDTYAGGLKKDLTADIADTSSTARGSVGNAHYRPADTTPIFTPVSNSEANLPTWGHLRSWARRHPDSTGAVAPVPPSDTEAGFAPMVVYASLGMDAYVDASRHIRLALFPVVVLSNPYPVAIAAADYDIGFRLPATARLHFQVAAPSVAPAAPGPVAPFLTVATLHLGAPIILSGATSQSTAQSFIQFRVDGDIIPPGETHIYRLDGSLANSVYEAATNRSLSRAPAVSLGSPIGLTNGIILGSSHPLDPSVTDDYYLQVLSENVARNTDSVEFVFAESGSLANTAGRYQSGAMIVSDRGIATQGARVFQETSVPQTIETHWRMDESEGARAALRIATRMEGRGDYQDAGRFGMPFLASPWLRANNLRAPHVIATTLESSAGSFNRAGTTIVGAVLTNNQVANRDVALFPRYHGHLINASGAMDITGSHNISYSTLFDILRSGDRLLSLGQFQHVPFSRYSFYSSYPFGNSMADVRVERTTTWRASAVPRPGTSGTTDSLYDLPWHLNRAIWDRYFVSGVPATLTQADIDSDFPLPNSRMSYHRENGAAPALTSVRGTATQRAAYDQAAARLLVSGAFNINSTSEQAWRALLGGALGLQEDSTYATGGDDIDEIIPFPRISHNLARSNNAPYTDQAVTLKGDSTDSNRLRKTLHHGNRGLHLGYATPSTNTSAVAVVNELARTIVREIRRRGPFLSLSDFVNRPIYATKQDAGIKGALQTAIDTMDSVQANPLELWNQRIGGLLVASQATPVFPGWDPEHYIGGPTSEVDTGRDAFRFAHSFAPKYLTQADILSSLGPQLTARSDTFIIRTYGETENPVTGNTEGRAWCEAVVQRLPDYVDDSVDPWDAATGANRTFGRRFAVVSFRWLSPSDL